MKSVTKFLIAVSAGLFICTISPVVSNAQAEKDEVALYQTMYGMEKRALIEEAMSLNEANKSAFWTVYEEFEKERRTIGEERINLIKNYAENFKAADDAKLDEIAKGALANESKFTKLESTYYEKMKKATNAATSFRWLQVERYLNTSIRMAIQDELPFLPERKN